MKDDVIERLEKGIDMTAVYGYKDTTVSLDFMIEIKEYIESLKCCGNCKHECFDSDGSYEMACKKEYNCCVDSEPIIDKSNYPDLWEFNTELRKVL